MFHLNVRLLVYPAFIRTYTNHNDVFHIKVEHCIEVSVQKPLLSVFKFSMTNASFLLEQKRPIICTPSVLSKSQWGSGGWRTYLQSGKDQFHLLQFELPQQVPKLANHCVIYHADMVAIQDHWPRRRHWRRDVRGRGNERNVWEKGGG